MVDRGAVVAVVVALVVVVLLDEMLDVVAGRLRDGRLAFRAVVVVVDVDVDVDEAAGVAVAELVERDVDVALPPQAVSPSATITTLVASITRTPVRRRIGATVCLLGMTIRRDAAVCRRPRTARSPG